MRLGIGVAATAALSLLLTLLVRTAARRYGIVAAPRKDRWHQRPTALMGGVAIFVAFIVGWLCFAPSVPRAVPILLSAGLLFLTGVVDDRVALKPYIKLAAQLAAASSTVFFGLNLHWTSHELVNNLITIFWLVGITNAVNLLDNMDGLAGGTTLIACVFLGITFGLSGQIAEAGLPLLLAAAVAGFLLFNFNPASIFMGDCGSMFLGFLLGGMALLSDTGRMRNLLGVLLTPVLILLIPIFDTCFVTVARKLNGRAVSEGGRDHTSHRLVALGMSERRAVLMLYLFAAVSGTLALTMRNLSLGVALVLITGFALGAVFIGLYLGKVKVYEEGKRARGVLIDVVAGFSHRRRLVEMLLDFLLMALAYYGAYLLRFEGEIPDEQFAIFVRTLPLIATVQIFFFLAGGVYRGIWRYVGLDDLINIARSVGIAALVNATWVLLSYRFFGPSRAVMIVNALLVLVVVSVSRFSFRLLAASTLR